MAQKHCPDVPAIVLGLKTELRPNFPALRLGFLKESTAFTVGQVRPLNLELRELVGWVLTSHTGRGGYAREQSVCLLRVLR